MASPGASQSRHQSASSGGGSRGTQLPPNSASPGRSRAHRQVHHPRPLASSGQRMSWGNPAARSTHNDDLFEFCDTCLGAEADSFYQKKIFFMFIFERERQSVMGEGQRERETRNPKQVPGSEPSAQSLMQGLKSRTVRCRPELKSDASPTDHPSASRT